eukprot:357718-Chlamydomonas_euryale.AAC.2
MGGAGCQASSPVRREGGSRGLVTGPVGIPRRCNQKGGSARPSERDWAVGQRMLSVLGLWALTAQGPWAAGFGCPRSLGCGHAYAWSP